MISNNSMSPIKSPRKMFTKNITPVDNPDAIIEMEKNKNLDKKWREKAEKELGETNDISYARVRQLRHLLEVSESLIRGRRDEAFLLRFLRAKKFDVDKAFRMIQKYLTMKQQSPELFRVSPPTQMKNMLEMQIQYMLPLRDVNGRQIYIFRVEKCDPYKCPVESVFRTNVLSLENAVRDPETQIAGLVVLLDMSGLGLGHARFLSPHLARKTVEVIQESFPMRFKAFHVLHEPFYFDAILAVLKPFLKDKIRKRIHLHGSDISSLHRHIPKEILPFEYGGTQPKFDNTLWRKKILDDEEYFMRLETYTIDDNKSKIITGSGSNIYTNCSFDNQSDLDNDEDDDPNNLQFIDAETEDSEFEDDTKFCNCDSPNDEPFHGNRFMPTSNGDYCSREVIEKSEIEPMDKREKGIEDIK